ncbi:MULTISPECIES: S9 family peptidase [Asticcacaulis]|uniref:alpha/beta hydrolase family protein n=1 Tax=Asticcacaulis TaxID=76890 RepID=UPI001AEB8E76|nr:MULTISPECIES: prolyl oligopeptidase family serine peptidase [Asticcacaulis]MBP2158112.1 dienelactone hydrolase [Asticcacaulis solisilvae]MDR6799157.1 dienelactone hydrolase [Asticcacaulis sp. BE141]
MRVLAGFCSVMALIAGGAQAQNPLGAPPPLEVFGQLPEVQHVDLSPDGRHAAMVATRSGQRYLVDLDLTTEKTVAQPLGDIRVRDVMWVGNRHVALVKSWTTTAPIYSTFKTELYTVNLQDMVTGKSRQLFLGMEDREVDPVVTGDIHVVKDAQDYRVTASAFSRANEGNYLFYSFGANDNRTNQIDFAGRNVVDWVLTSDGKPHARSEYDFERKIWRLRFRSGSDWMSGLEIPATIDIPDTRGLGRDGQSVLVFQEGKGFFEVSADGTTGALESGTYSSPLFHPLTRRFNGFASHGGWVDYDFLDPDMKALPAKVAKAMPGYRTQFAAFAENPQKLIVYGEGPGDAGSYTFIDFATGTSVPVGATYPDIPEAWVPVKQAIKYKAADGLEIEAYLTLPPGRDAKSLPLIVLPHGGPETRDDLSFEWDVAAYASRGYAVLQPNFRGSAGYGADFVAAGHGEFGRKMQSDLSDGVRHLVSGGLVDAARVCIVGYSYGGYAALAGATFEKTYRCAASYAGLSDLPAFTSYISTKTYSDKSAGSLYLRRYLGDMASQAAVSPARHAAGVDIPVLIIHGRDDTTVPVMQALTMRNALKAAGKAHEYVELKGEDHYLSRAETRLQMLKAVVAFVEKHNPAY